MSDQDWMKYSWIIYKKNSLFLIPAPPQDKLTCGFLATDKKLRKLSGFSTFYVSKNAISFTLSIKKGEKSIGWIDGYMDTRY